MKKIFFRNVALFLIITLLILTSTNFYVEKAKAGSYDGQDIALAILANQSTYISSYYLDKDNDGCGQGTVLTSLGRMEPTNGPTFAFLSTGTAGVSIVTTDEENPGNERGTWYKNRYGRPRDQASITMTLQVPPYMHYLYYDFQFFSTEYPEYIGSKYNDKFEVEVNSPSKGTSTYVCDVNSGNFVLDSNYIDGTGFDIFAQSGIPDDVDIVDTTPRSPGADAGATALITRGGESHPVSPNEEITVTFSIRDGGDNQFDSGVFLDNLVFLGYARTEIIARETVEDINGKLAEPGETLEYNVIISNTGNANQNDNDGNEFENPIPANTTYIPGSVSATSGSAVYNDTTNKINWNGMIAQESSVMITYQVMINPGIENGTIISSQGTVFWDSNEDGTNNDIEYTDDASVDDGIDIDDDGETDDDDPTEILAIAFEPPTEVTEDFSDDTTGENATQTYLTRLWFETNTKTVESNFEVAGNYHYSTSKSFKIKLRNNEDYEDPLTWKYYLSNLESNIIWWETWFTCGNASEQADLNLTFKNDDNQDIAKIRFEYVNQGTHYLTPWVLKMYYYDQGWNELNSGYFGGYLYNDWYKLRIEQHGSLYVNYTLYDSSGELVDFKQGNKLTASFSNLGEIQWTSSKSPVACPMFFFDEHKIGLTN